jgi:hypothetical protein
MTKTQYAAQWPVPRVVVLEGREHLSAVPTPETPGTRAAEEGHQTPHASPFFNFGLRRARSTTIPSWRISAVSTAHPAAVSR